MDKGKEKKKRPRYPERLRHQVPDWVTRSEAVYHIRIRTEPDGPSLVEPLVAKGLLAGAAKYAELGWWWPRIFLLMPDHLHMLTSFHPDKSMGRIISDWKRFQASQLGVRWQNNFFDHRLRNDESLEEKWHYIRMNPVRAGLCDGIDDWPHWLDRVEDR